MATRTFYVVDQSGMKHEIIMENQVSRYYNAFKDGVKEFFIAECLSFDAAFREYCARKHMKPVSLEGASTPNIFSAYSCSGEQNAKGPSDHVPADYLITLETLHDLLKKEVISRSEFDMLKTKITSYFCQKS